MANCQLVCRDIKAAQVQLCMYTGYRASQEQDDFGSFLMARLP